MSAPFNALAALDTNLRDRAERAARYGKKADKEAGRRGFRNLAGDRKADFERHLLQQLSAARAAVAELIEADTEYDRARSAWLADHSNHGEFLAARLAWDRRAAALARVRGAA